MTDRNDHTNDHARIPDELIDAALDGELCDELENEIAHALRYDAEKRTELNATLDAIGALRETPESPDFQCGVLNALDTRRSFLSTSMRRMVRTGRLAAAASILLGLMLVSALQTLSPRLSTLAPHATPVDDVASAVGEDTRRFVDTIDLQVRLSQAGTVPWLSSLGSPHQFTAVTQVHTLDRGAHASAPRDLVFIVQCEGILIPDEPREPKDTSRDERAGVIQVP